MMAITQMYAIGLNNYEMGQFDVKAVMASDWREAFAKAFPTYETWLKEAEDEQGHSLSYDAAREVAINQDWDFAIDVLEGLRFGDPVPMAPVDVKKGQPFSALTAEERERLSVRKEKK